MTPPTASTTRWSPVRPASARSRSAWSRGHHRIAQAVIVVFGVDRLGGGHHSQFLRRAYRGAAVDRVRVGTKAATRRYTYGFGRAEDLAGMFVVAMIGLSAIVAGYEAVTSHPSAAHRTPRLGRRRRTARLHRQRTGRALPDPRRAPNRFSRFGRRRLHARTDGFTSLAVVIGAGGVALGFPLADPIVGLFITVAILAVLRTAVRDVFRRLIDGVDPSSSTPPRSRWPPARA